MRLWSILEELRLGSRRISDDADVDISTEVHAFVSLFMDASHELEKNALLDDLVAINGRCDAGNELGVNPVVVNHHLELVEFGFCQSSDEGFAVALSGILLSSQVDSGTLKTIMSMCLF